MSVCVKHSCPKCLARLLFDWALVKKALKKLSNHFQFKIESIVNQSFQKQMINFIVFNLTKIENDCTMFPYFLKRLIKKLSLERFNRIKRKNLGQLWRGKNERQNDRTNEWIENAMCKDVNVTKFYYKKFWLRLRDIHIHKKTIKMESNI